MESIHSQIPTKLLQEFLMEVVYASYEIRCTRNVGREQILDVNMTIETFLSVKITELTTLTCTYIVRDTNLHFGQIAIENSICSMFAYLNPNRFAELTRKYELKTTM